MSAEAQATEAIPVHQMPLVKTEMREIHRPLTAEERVEKDHKAYQLKREILEEEESLKNYTKERKGAIQKLATERDALIDIGEKGRSEWVDVEIRLDQERGLRLIVRADTLEVVTEEPMTYADRQPCLFPATLEDGAPRVPVSRRVRAAFLGTLGDKPGGAAVLNLHNEGLLDPTDFEVEGKREWLLTGDEPESAILRDCIADAESDLDEMEATLAQMIADDECSEADLIAIAINSRTVPTSDDAETGAIWDKLLEVRDARAAIDFCDANLQKLPAETVEHDDRSEQLANDGTDAHDPENEETTVTETVAHPAAASFEPLSDDAPAPSSRAMRDGRIYEVSQILDVSQLRTAHRCGALDPTEDELSRARRDIGTAGVSKRKLKGFLEEADVAESALARELKTSAKARMAIDRKSFPTKAKTVDVLIGEVRWQRARLDVALEAEAT